MQAVCLEIGIDWQHVAETAIEQRYQLICDKQWLQTLEKRGKIAEFPIYPDLDRRAHPEGTLPYPWTKILMQIYRKQPNVRAYPLASYSIDGNCDDDGANSPVKSYSQAIVEVTQANFRNLWSAAYESYRNVHLPIEKELGHNSRRLSKSPSMDLVPYDVILKEVIQKIFQCSIIDCKLDREDENTRQNFHENHRKEPFCNILHALIGIETTEYIVVLFYPPCIITTLYDCVTYSPTILNNDYNKSLFIIYQICQVAKYLHQYNMLLGEIILQDIFLTENLWIMIIPRVESNINVFRIKESQMQLASDVIGFDNGNKFKLNIDEEQEQKGNPKLDLKLAYDLNQFSLRDYCEMWCNGQLSNYDYLTVLNNAAGRSLTNPAYHHIMPWVTDFTSRNGQNWRDLTKSKYRLNKGDIQLDLMFSQANHQQHTNFYDVETNQHMAEQIPHHVSDFLSEITYFVYMARRTPQHILKEHVRPKWVPAEYPVSIQRLQEWTPDECIPEFYSDPMIFKTIHEDLPDLELPIWASCPEDFICKHREALEAQYVSERLHHWIDLNFGYKLSGKAAVKSKNVCLSIVDNHSNLCQRGMVQLFIHPHPPKLQSTPWFSKQAPRIQQLFSSNNRKSEGHFSRIRKKQLKATSRRLAKSSENLHQEEPFDDPDTQCSRSTGGHSPCLSSLKITNNFNDDNSITSNFYKAITFIELPKGYNPLALLQSLEKMKTFIAKTFPKQQSTKNAKEKLLNSDLLFDSYAKEHSFINHLFSDVSDIELLKENQHKAEFISNRTKASHSISLLDKRKEHDMQIFACLIVELFAAARLRPVINNLSRKFADRLKSCRTVYELSNSNDIPKCLQYITSLLLYIDSNNVITDKGLPPPTMSQILQYVYQNELIAFPSTYYTCYALLRTLHSFKFTFTLLELHSHFYCNGLDCERYKFIECNRMLYERKIAECQVMSCCAYIATGLLKPVPYQQFPIVDILLPHIVELLYNEHTSILTAWHLFDDVAQALGVIQTQKYLLRPIMKLYDVESFERGMISVRNRSQSASQTNFGLSISSSFKSRKSVKLYHHSFLLKLIVRFGLKCFLHHFIAPLIEAVGGYRDPVEGNGLHYHTSINNTKQSATTAINNQTEEFDIPTQLCPSFHSPSRNTEVLQNYASEIDDVFGFIEDVSLDVQYATSDRISNKSLESFDLTTTSEDDKPKYSEGITDITREEGTSLTEITTNESEILITTPTTRSRTIAIPSKIFRRTQQMNAIGCDIGSKKSIDSIEMLQNVIIEGTECQAGQQYHVSNEPMDNKKSTTVSLDNCDSFASKMTLQNSRIAEMSCESLIWLSHRLGPVLTCRYVTKNLLKMLTLCYVGQENLLPEIGKEKEDNNLNYFTLANARVVGDRSAARVLECLISIAAIYGENVILQQYFPHIRELINSGVKRITGSLEGAIISTLQLVKLIIPCLMDTTIMESMKDVLLKSIIQPVLEFVTSTKVLMPNGFLGRAILIYKLLDVVYVLCVRIGPDMSRENLCISVLRPFFLVFNKVFRDSVYFKTEINCVEMLETYVVDDESDSTREMEELQDVFTAALAHRAYLAFLHFLDEDTMRRTLINFEFIITLCLEIEQPNYACSTDNANNIIETPTVSNMDTIDSRNSFGTRIIGNRIDVAHNCREESIYNEISPDLNSNEILELVTYKCDQLPTNRHLKGNWLAYWRHEISRPEKDVMLNLKQIKLQAFLGHTNSVKALVTLDNENSFISASKDKTVKLWSLRNEGDGSKVSSCQFTYTAHKKPLHSLAFLECMRYVISCDSGIHIWDPFIGRPLAVLDNSKQTSATVVKCLPTPSPIILTGTSEASVRIIDARCMQYTTDWRVCTNSQANATVRCLAVSPSGNWLAAGLSTGTIVTLDTRTGVLLNNWKPMECDLLQLVAANDHQLISSALDHSLAVWNVNDGILHYQLTPPTEPAHYLQSIGTQLVYATTGNRIGIYSDLRGSHGNHAVSKLHSETFKGVLTSLVVLPQNRCFLVGNECGNITLLC